MDVYIACDHAGIVLKKHLIESAEICVNFIDLGSNSQESVDYPDYAALLAINMRDDSQFGVLICGSGIGMAIAANRYNNIRAVNAINIEQAKLSREHNDANVLCLGARFLDTSVAIEIFTTFISSNFDGGRHLERIKKLRIIS